VDDDGQRSTGGGRPHKRFELDVRCGGSGYAATCCAPGKQRFRTRRGYNERTGDGAGRTGGVLDQPLRTEPNMGRWRQPVLPPPHYGWKNRWADVTSASRDADYP